MRASSFYVDHVKVFARYSLGVSFSRFRNVEQKLLSLLKPEAKAISLMDMLFVRSRYLAELRRIAIRYWCGVMPVSDVKILVK